MASHATGNTEPVALKARDWQLTLNEVDKYDALAEYLKGLKSNNYLISCKEIAPTTGHEHIHIYVQFTNMIKLSIKKCCGAHIERCRGTPQQNIEYIKKDGNIIEEIGIPRKWGGLPSIAEAEKASADELKQLPLNYYNTVNKILEKKTCEKYFKPPYVVWLYGPTGAGKTRKAFEAGCDNVEYANGFFSDWGDSRKICIEEMRGQIPYPTLLKLLDGYHNYYTVNIKGGYKKVDLDVIYITSPKRPEDCYPCQDKKDSIEQLKRRITEIINCDESAADLSEFG